jgi:hypothetical protein
MHISLNIKYLRKSQFVELIIAQGSCCINVLLRKPLGLYFGNTYFKWDLNVTLFTKSVEFCIL